VSRLLSGILSAPREKGLGSHPSLRSTWRLSGLPDGRAAHVPRLTLLRVGFTKPTRSPWSLVRSYRTVSPLPVPVTQPSAVCSLWHCPAGHPDLPLASTLPCGVPTFLDSIARTAATLPTHHQAQSATFGRQTKQAPMSS
jgi:hypothetical protein